MELIRDRLDWFLKHKSLTKYAFAKAIGFQSSSLTHIFSGRNKPSITMIAAIAENYPQLSLDWLITGIGEALKDGTLADIQEQTNPNDRTSAPSTQPNTKSHSTNTDHSNSIEFHHTPQNASAPQMLEQEISVGTARQVIIISSDGSATVHNVVN